MIVVIMFDEYLFDGVVIKICLIFGEKFLEIRCLEEVLMLDVEMTEGCVGLEVWELT